MQEDYIQRKTRATKKYINQYLNCSSDYQRDSALWANQRVKRETDLTWEIGCRLPLLELLASKSKVNILTGLPIPHHSSSRITFGGIADGFKDLSEIYRKLGKDKDSERCRQLYLHFERESDSAYYDTIIECRVGLRLELARTGTPAIAAAAIAAQL